MRALLGTALAALALAAGVRPGAAQSVQVEVRGAGDRPLAGALVTVLGPRGAVLARTLADEQGRARLQLGPGRHRLRIDAIGHQGVTPDAFELGPGGGHRVTVALEPRPLDLGELVVRSGGPPVCRLDGDDGGAGRLWEEARKALLATQVTAASGALLDITTFERDLTRAAIVREERTGSRRGVSARPFQAIDPEVLHREGYVRPEGGELWFHGPDAELLLSDRFVRDHCFRLVAAPAGGDSLVGLGFEPVPRRPVADIRGVLWLDAGTAELRHLEFGYTGLELPPGATDIGGRVGFRRLPGGAWIVGEWSIRMPRLVRRRLSTGSRDSVAGYREAGGHARLAQGPLPPPGPGAVLAGVVLEAATATPLAGTIVSIQAGQFADTSDAEGRFRIAAPAEGRFLVTAVDRRALLLGGDTARAAAALVRGRTDSLQLAIPLLDLAAARLCPAAPAPRDSGLLVGQVTDSATGAPAAGARVEVRVPGRRVVSRAVVAEQAAVLETVTDPAGWFAVCWLPLGTEVRIAVTHPAGRSAAARVTLGPGRFAEVRIGIR
jgi:hypothetical protein